MIRKYLLLLKIQLLNFFGINKMIHSNDKKEKNRLVVMCVAWAILLVVLLMYSAIISYSCIYMGAGNIIPVLMLTVSSLITMFLTFFKVNGMLFSFKDYDSIMSLPVSSSLIILSRLTMIYIMNVLLSFITVAPSIIVYGIYVNASVSVYLMQIIGGIFLSPFIPITIAATVGAVIMAVSVRFKYKNAIALILSMGVILAVLLLSVSISDETPQMLLDFSAAIDKNMTRIYPFAYFYRKAVLNADWGSFLLFTAASVSVAALFVYLLSKFYTKINTALFSQAVHRGYNLNSSSARTPFISLYQKELRRLFSCTTYALNSCTGALLLLVSAVISIIINPVQLINQTGSADVLEGYIKCFPFIIAVFTGITSTSSSSLSLEGKSRWLMCSAPVSQETVYKAKIAVNLTVLLPVTVISGLLFSIAFRVNIWQTLFIIAIPAAYSVLIAVTGIFFNLKFPNYDWTSEYYAVKNSMSVLCTVFSGMFTAIAFFILNQLFANQFLLFQFISLIIILLAAYILYGKIKHVRLYV